MLEVNYKFYATLLDSYCWFLQSEADNAFQEFIDKINRVPFTSEAADRGTAFNKLVDEIIEGRAVLDNSKKPGKTIIDGFEFDTALALNFGKELAGSTTQLFTSGVLETPLGNVLLYGYLDNVIKDTAVDIKTTGNYTFPKFLKTNNQHFVYPYCLRQEGIMVDKFLYLVTDFSGVYKEVYHYDERLALDRLIPLCTGLIQFLKRNRALITDKKVFNED